MSLKRRNEPLQKTGFLVMELKNYFRGSSKVLFRVPGMPSRCLPLFLLFRQTQDLSDLIPLDRLFFQQRRRQGPQPVLIS